MFLSSLSYADTEISTASTNLGIGTTSTKNALSISSTLSVGNDSYTSVTAPSGGAIIQGNVGIGTSSPQTGLAVMNGNVGIGTWTAAGGNLIVKGGGNVGIGSSWPGTALDVVGTVRATTLSGSGAISGLTTGYLPKSATATTVSDSVILQSGSNIGIGTATPQGSFVVVGGNVGIGSVSPTQVLDVSGTGKFDTILVSGSSAGTFYGASGFQWDPNNVSGSGFVPAMSMLSTGNVGIGTTNGGPSTPQSPLQVQGNTFLSNLGGSALTFDLNGSNFGHIYSTLGDSTIYFGGTANRNDAPTGTPNFFIDFDTNNVGINTLTASQSLQVGGTLQTQAFKMSTGASAGYVLTSGSTGIGTWMPASGGSSTPGGSSPQLQYNNAGSFGGVSSSASNGTNIGIGTVSNVNRLNIVGNVGISTLSNSPYVTTTLASPNALVVEGNVGIGTWAPTALLEAKGALKATSIQSTGISGSTQCVQADTNGNLSGTGSACGGSGSTPGGGLNAVQYNSPVGTFAGNASILSNNGTNVGIGTTNGINAILDVRGGQYVSGNLGVGTVGPRQKLEIAGTGQMTGFKLTGSGEANGNVLVTNSVGVGTWMPATTIPTSIALTTTGTSGASTLTGNTLNIPQYTGGGSSQWITSTNVGIGTYDNVGIGSLQPSSRLDIRPSNIEFIGCTDSLATAISRALSGDTLKLAANCTYSISSSLDINKALTIQGQGFSTIIDAGSNAISILNITSDNVNVSDLKIIGTNAGASTFPVVNVNGSASSTFQNVNFNNIWINVAQTGTCNQIVTYYDAGGEFKNSRVQGTCSNASGQIVGLMAQYYSTNDLTTTVYVTNSLFDISNTNASASLQVRGIMHWHNGASVSVPDTTMIISNVNAYCSLTAGGSGTECLQNQGPNLAPNPGVTGADYTYVYNSIFDGTTKNYANCPTTSCRDYRIDDYAQTHLFNVTLGNGSETTQNNASIFRHGLLEINQIKGAAPTIVPSDITPANIIEMTGSAGGTNTNTGSVVGKTGSGILLTGGVGGAATAATVIGTGGIGGGFSFTAGAGAAQSTATSTTNTGGAGGGITLTTGAGGAATTAATTNGGAGGDFTLNTGAGGAGTTTTGIAGRYLLKINGTEKMRLNQSGNVGISTANPTGLLEVGPTGQFRIANPADTMVFTNTGDPFADQVKFSNTSSSMTSNSTVFRVSSSATTATKAVAFIDQTGNNAGVTGDVLRVQMSGGSSPGAALHVYGGAGSSSITALFENGNVGISTTVPANRLSILGASSIGDATYAGTTAPTNGLLVKGNVGLGSTAPGTALDVNGTARTTGLQLNLAPLANGNILVSNSVGLGTWMPAITVPTSVTLTTTGSSGASTLTGNVLNIPQYSGGGSSQLFTKTGTNGNVGIGTYDAIGIGTFMANAAFVVLPTPQGSNVGIGTWNPRQALELAGTGQMTGFKLTGSGESTGNILVTNSVGVGTWQSASTIPTSISLTTSGSSGASTLTGNVLNIPQYTGAGGSSQWLTVTNVGIGTYDNVGIGTTTPQAALVITKGNVGIGTWTAAYALDINGGMRLSNTGDSYINGNLGIGTTIPMNILSVQGSMAVGSAAYAGTTAPSNSLVVSGNVGIGSLAPGAALDVQGSVRVSTGTAGQAACFKTDKTLGQCTSIVGAGGACTCI